MKNYLVDYFKQQNLEFPEGFIREEYVNRNDASVLIPMEGLIYAEGGEPFISPNSVSIVYTKDKLKDV
ncbi:hypothetical protein [uncultured Clostridium sp.]|uniref:hypothetical protein n=1 Tax=uncultured Clostridium sp. TaxID=59620 RepID=UPI0028EDE830|nr:hypothetical protein [uncultured Clostridium sp.]